MEFRDFKIKLQRQFNTMKEGTLFRVTCEKEFLWNLYQDSFDPKHNPIFRERREHDCVACKSFIRNAGSIVAIVNNKLVSLWDVEDCEEYQPSVNNLKEFIHGHKIDNVFLSVEGNIGIDKNYERVFDELTSKETKVITWEHFHLQLPKEVIVKGVDKGPKEADYRSNYDVLKRSLNEITRDAIVTVIDLINQDLYRGQEKLPLVEAYLKLHDQFHSLPQNLDKDLFYWSQVVGPNKYLCKIRNDVIGTLLSDISEDKPLEHAVKAYETKVAPANYQRTVAPVSKAQVERAKAALAELGYLESLDRRFARYEDLNVNDILFASQDTKKRIKLDVFDIIDTKSPAKNLDKATEVTIEHFIGYPSIYL